MKRWQGILTAAAVVGMFAATFGLEHALDHQDGGCPDAVQQADAEGWHAPDAKNKGSKLWCWNWEMRNVTANAEVSP